MTRAKDEATPDSPATAGPRPVLRAICNIMNKVGSVRKEGTNEFQKYKYATAADVLHKLQKLMADEGLVIIQTERERKLIDDDSVLSITYRFLLMHVSGDQITGYRDNEGWGTALEFTGLSSARNSKGGFDDKAANKCNTAAHKYFLINLFKIPTGDYDDADAQDDRPKHSKKAVAPLPPSAEAVPAHPQPNVAPVAPMAIAHQGKKPAEWAVEFLGHINAAASVSDVDVWLALNQEPLDLVRTKAPMLSERIGNAVSAKIDQLATAKAA